MADCDAALWLHDGTEAVCNQRDRGACQAGEHAFHNRAADWLVRWSSYAGKDTPGAHRVGDPTPVQVGTMLEDEEGRRWLVWSVESWGTVSVHDPADRTEFGYDFCVVLDIGWEHVMTDYSPRGAGVARETMKARSPSAAALAVQWCKRRGIFASSSKEDVKMTWSSPSQAQEYREALALRYGRSKDPIVDSTSHGLKVRSDWKDDHDG